MNRQFTEKIKVFNTWKEMQSSKSEMQYFNLSDWKKRKILNIQGYLSYREKNYILHDCKLTQ